MKIKKFYDTSSLLLSQDIEDSFVISSITLDEIEHIKSSNNKNFELQANARKLLHWLENNSDKYNVILYKSNFISKLAEQGFEITNDLKILSCAIEYNKTEPIEFITNDLCLRHIAQLYLPVDSIKEKEDAYTGYKHLRLSDEEIADLYAEMPKNNHDLLPNEYGIIYDESGDLVDLVCWTGSSYRPINGKPISSKYFGKLSPYDIYQKMTLDSLRNNQLTMLHGSAGSAKTLMSLVYFFSLLEQNRIDKIIIFCNPVATADSARLGYTPGTIEEKLLDSQIGNLLISKFGSRLEVEKLLQSEKLVLLPLSNIRGYDTTGMRAGIYIPECQNMNIPLLKLSLQRIGEDSVCILDGDFQAQVDMREYSGTKNGMRRASQVFRGQEFYGEVKLVNNYRSKISSIAEQM